ncbi:MAG: hypothetical protein KF756_14310, partial [Acidobacteria bacterium]|nr:hypothetical protein [Acidobacteriota bacterium]
SAISPDRGHRPHENKDEVIHNKRNLRELSQNHPQRVLLEALQPDAAEWVRHYNTERPLSGKYC